MEPSRRIFPKRQKKPAFFGYSAPISVDSVYFFVGFLDENRHSPPLSEVIPQIIAPHNDR